MSEPDRIVGELLQPGGYLKLLELGLEDCVDEIDAQRVFGYALYKDGKNTKLSYPLENFDSDVSGRSFHNSHFIQQMREKASSLPNVKLEQRTVTFLLEENGTIKGSGQEFTTKAPLAIVWDGCFSNLRRSLCDPKVEVPSHFVGLILEDCNLPYENHGHVILGDPSPILFYPISSTEIRCLVDVPGQKLPSVAFQFGFASLVINLIWILNLHPRPNIRRSQFAAILPLVMAHTLGNLLTNISLGKVSVSFTHTIKAMESFFTVVLSSFLLGEFTPSYLKSATSQGLNVRELCIRSVLVALCFHAYQQVSYGILEKVSPVTHSVGNCVKACGCHSLFCYLPPTPTQVKANEKGFFLRYYLVKVFTKFICSLRSIVSHDLLAATPSATVAPTAAAFSPTITADPCAPVLPATASGCVSISHQVEPLQPYKYQTRTSLYLSVELLMKNKCQLQFQVQQPFSLTAII
ncbi:hypothetical protein KIW84_UN0863 [Lathyrus oleraceus]|nr:hypothetical protein KIW84_UN0863 [Pisum sativum]